jgi:serine O-acetyltransferase
MRSAMCADIKRYLRESTSRGAVLQALVQQYGLQATLVYRLGRALRLRARQMWWWPLVLPGWIVYWPAALFVRAAYGIRLALSADIGPGLYVGHFGGIELVNCTLGPGCNIGEQTRIGTRADRAGPRIGARVWMGGHVVIAGNVNVGDGATIGAGAHVTADVPARALLMGNPARVMSRDYDNSAIL